MLKKFLILPVVFLFAACNNESPEAGRKNVKYQEIKEAAEGKKRNFDPGFVTASHAARVYKIENYEIRDSLIMRGRDTFPVTRTVAGEMPERNAKGPFKVTFLGDKKNDTLYHYGMPSPLYSRREHGPGKGLYRVKAGSFLVPVPPVKNITRIILEDSDGTRHESTLRIQ